jgi:hypothetical protein
VDGGFLQVLLMLSARVARWFIFKPKIQIWVTFGGYCIRRCWNILWPFDQFWYITGHIGIGILWLFGIFLPDLVYL